MSPNIQEASVAESELRGAAETRGSSLTLEARHAKTVVTESKTKAPPAQAPIDKSLLIDAAYDEYCRLRDAGKAPKPEVFCERYPELQASLRKLLEVHELLEENSQLLAEETAPDWPALGDTFLGFKLNRELGRGAFARVFLGEEPALGHRKVAVKIAFRGASEAETLGRLRHPNIVPVHSVRQDPQTSLTAVCMPFLGSATLTNVLERIAQRETVPVNGSILADVAREASLECDLPSSAYSGVSHLRSQSYVQTAVELGVQIAEALAFVHARGIFHRDLKPSNVLFGADGVARLLDFNLSFDEETAQQRLGGTLPYMAPEQLKACDASKATGPVFVGASADIFSLGLILYELLTGKHPFGPIPSKLKTHEVRNLLLERQEAGPRSIRQLNPKIGLQLAATIEQCLAFDPVQRPESAAKLAASLRRSQTIVAKVVPWAKSHSKALIAAGILLTLGTLGAPAALPKSDPTSVQKYHQGLAQLRRNEVSAAIQSFDQALQEDPNSADAWFARGVANQKQLDPIFLRAAIKDFQQAYDLSPDSRSASCMVYCLGALHEHNEAITWFSAIDPELVTVIDLNNFSCCLTHRNKPGDSLIATMNFRKALGKAPGFLTIVNNYQIADFRLARQEKRATMPPKPTKFTLDLVEPSFEDLR